MVSQINSCDDVILVDSVHCIRLALSDTLQNVCDGCYTADVLCKRGNYQTISMSVVKLCMMVLLLSFTCPYHLQ